MTWVGARSHGRRTSFNPKGLNAGPFSGRVPRHRMARGTLTLETVFPDRFNQPLDLIDYEHWQGDRRSMNMVLGPNGRLWFAVEKGADLSVLSLDLSGYAKETPIQINYSWDAVQNASWLCAENLETGEINVAAHDRAVAIHVDDLARILYDVGVAAVRPAATTFAFSDDIEPVGYSTGVGAQARVQTERGEVPIADLIAGDLIVTHDGGLTPLIAVHRSEVPSFGRWKPVVLARPLLNLEQSFHTSPDTRLLTGGVDTEYHFGTEKVALKAENLAAFLPQRRAENRGAEVYYQLVLETPVAFQISGASVLPLEIRHDINDPIVHAMTGLSHLSPNEIFQSRVNAHRALAKHEAIALLSERYL